MASIFMRIDGNDDIKGSATVDKIDGKKGCFAIDSFSWSAMRGVSVDIGNASNNDAGMVAMGEVNCSKTVDGATPYLTTFLYHPGNEGKKVEIFFTKPSREGKGLEQYLAYTLENARIASYSVSGSDGSQPTESFSLTYTILDQAYRTEDAGGKLEKAASVKYNTKLAEMKSGVTLK